MEIDELKQMPNNVALAFPSTGEKTLPATHGFLRPRWVFGAFPDLGLDTPWMDWPEELRKSHDLDPVPQGVPWGGWDKASLEESEVVSTEQRLAGFIQNS